MFQVALGLFSSMADHSLLDASDIGPAVYVIRTTARRRALTTAPGNQGMLGDNQGMAIQSPQRVRRLGAD